MTSSPLRLATAAVLAAIGLAGAGLVWEWARFGPDTASAASRLEASIRRQFAGRASQLDRLGAAIAGDGRLIEAASAPSSDRLEALFDNLATLARAESGSAVSATVYVAPGPAAAYRVLAWSEGPAEKLPVDRLQGPAGVFVAHGASGLHLVAVRPIEVDGRRIGTVATETILAANTPNGADGTYEWVTAFGTVLLEQHFAGGAGAPADTFVLSNDRGDRLIDIRYTTDQLLAVRRAFRRRSLALAGVPLLLSLLVFAGRLLDRRRSTRAAAFAGWSAAAGALFTITAIGLLGLCRAADLPPAIDTTIASLLAACLVAVGPVSWWWRRHPRRWPRQAASRFVVEQAVAGVVAAGLLLLLAEVLRDRIDAAHLTEWQFPLFPFDLQGLLYLAGVLLVEVAVAWTVIAVLSVAASRWALAGRRPASGVAALALWITPTVLMATVRSPLQPLPVAGLLLAVVLMGGFALGAIRARRAYRRAAQATRLVLLFGALYVPAVVLYPMAWFAEDRTARAIVEDDYAPAVVGHAATLVTELHAVQAEIDAMPASFLTELVESARRSPSGVPSHQAFQIWDGTSLARTRLTSAIELYGQDRALVSRFALNIPEYLSRAIARQWEGNGCAWHAYAEIDRFGGAERPMLHAERGLCGPDGRPTAAIVVHVARDFQALPFVAPSNPYADVVGSPSGADRGSRLANLQLAVYGWDYRPVFGRRAWSISNDLADELSRSRAGFWRRLTVGPTAYDVYFTNDRRNIFALGVPAPTTFDHLTRLAAQGTLAAGLFILLLCGATAYAPFAGDRPAPLRALFQEIRTSFYRKLFLFFVLAALGPVLVLALAFSGYMTRQLHDDVQTEASGVVTVAQRVLEEVLALQAPRGATSLSASDDVMVWTGRALEQDVNLYEGADLVATSQRDLFDSGLLPTRTPAEVYRAIALDRQPTAVVEDRLGTSAYLVAAAPFRSRGSGAVLSVPLPLRQHDIQLETDAFDRGVLVGAAFVVLLAAFLGASVAGRISDPIARVTRAAGRIAAGDLDVRVVADTADELRQLVDDFNRMAATLGAQRAELARTHQFRAWAEMARQVAHEIKNPLTPIQLATEHLQRVHDDRGRPLGAVFDQCVTTVLRQVRLLRQIAGEFANFAGEPTPHLAVVDVAALVEDVLAPYRAGFGTAITMTVDVPAGLPPFLADRTLVARALTNVVENAWQAMPQGGRIQVWGDVVDDGVAIRVTDTGVGMEPAAAARAFEPYFSTKTGGSGLGLANARRNVERCGGSMTLTSVVGEGTTITMILPRAVTGAAAPDASGVA